jgi:hypothetical protein
LDAQPQHDPSGVDPAERRRAGGSRFERSVAAVTGVVFLVAGAWAFFAPASFFDAAATFEPYNVHLIRDIGAFQIGIGAMLVLALLVRDTLLAALAGAGTGAAFHLISHLIDHDLGGDPAVDIPVFGLTAMLLLAAAISRAAALRRETVRLGRSGAEVRRRKRPTLGVSPSSGQGSGLLAVSGSSLWTTAAARGMMRAAVDRRILLKLASGGSGRRGHSDRTRHDGRRGEGEMHHPLTELPLIEDFGEDFRGRQIEWGGMIVSYETFPKGVDATPLFTGLPGDSCQSPHWGYILKGRVRVKRSRGEELLVAGDVYHLEPGHTPVFEEDTEILEFSPAAEYRKTIEVVARNMAAMEAAE